jgi:hypothetical protein
MLRKKSTHILPFAMAVVLAAAACASPDVGYQEDGTYVLEAHEEASDCNQLGKTLWGHLQKMRDLPSYAEWERDNEPQTAVLALGRLFGAQNSGLAYLEDYDRQRAHVMALHRLMVGKGCAVLDVEGELAPMDAEIAPYRS